LFIIVKQIYKVRDTGIYYSFTKLDFTTFRGIKKTLQAITNHKQIKFIPRKNLSKDSILTPLEDKLVLLDKDFFKKYIKAYNVVSNYKFYVNSLISHNYINFQRINSTLFLNIPMYFKIN